MTCPSEMPLVSAVIPTKNRPELLCRAVRSVLTQTYKNLEILVVVDGPDNASVEALQAMEQPQIRVIVLAENVGGSEARNTGVRYATGDLIAFLDDDDEWLPEKIKHQITTARCAPNTIVTCQYLDRHATGDILRPQHFYRPDEPISEYLFCESSPFHPTRGFLATPTLLVPKSLLLQTPFTPGLERNQDSDWLLRVMDRGDVSISTVPGPLAIVHNELTSGRVGSKYDWRYSLRWAVASRHLFTRRALAFFLATHCAFAASKQGEGLSGSLRLLHACWRYGRISPMVLWFFLRHAALAPMFRLLAPKRLKARVESFRHR